MFFVLFFPHLVEPFGGWCILPILWDAILVFPSSILFLLPIKNTKARTMGFD